MIKLKTWGKSKDIPIKDIPDPSPLGFGMTADQFTLPIEEEKWFDDEFLEESIKDNTRILIFLINGVKLEGTILAYNTRSIKFTYEDQTGTVKCTQIISRHAIASMRPSKWIKKYADDDE